MLGFSHVPMCCVDHFGNLVPISCRIEKNGKTFLNSTVIEVPVCSLHMGCMLLLKKYFCYSSGVNILWSNSYLLCENQDYQLIYQCLL